MNKSVGKETIFKQRAEKLAVSKVVESQPAGTLEVLLFALSNERYALESIYIKEVYPTRELTFLPSVPLFVKGVINVRRKIYSVVDLRKLFNLAEKGDGDGGRVIILEKDRMAFGLFAEEVLGMRTLFPEDLQPPLPSMTGIHEELVKGVTDDCVVLLDGQKILNSSTLVVEQKAAAN